MTRDDIIGLVLSYAYAFGLLLIVEAIGKRFNWPQYLTRKIIHIGAGLWIWGQLYFFDHWYFGIIPFASFIVLNYVFYRQQTFKAMDSERSSPGTIYFAISITILMALMWRTGGDQIDHAPIAVAALMAMTLGDGMASIIGEAWGNHPYTFMEHRRTQEGSLAMAVFSFLGIYLTLRYLPNSPLSPYSLPLGSLRVLQLSIAGTIVATISEALSPSGSDNLTVPLFTALVLYLLWSVLP